MKNYDEIVFSKDKYESREEMYRAISTQLMILMDNDYMCKVYDDDTDIIVIQYAHDNKIDDWGGPYLEWLTYEEADCVENFRAEKEE